MDNGWIKIHRQLADWEWFTDSHMVHLLVHLLICCNHQPKRWKGVVVDRGQCVTGLNSLHESTGISIRTLRTCLARLEETGEISRKTTNKFSIITVRNYEKYQLTENERQASDKQPTSNRQRTRMNKNDKNYVVEKKLLRWLNQNGKGEGYAQWLYREVGEDAVKKAWKKVLGGRTVNSPADFVELCKTLKND